MPSRAAWNIPSAQFDPLTTSPTSTSIRAVTIGYDQLNFNCADKTDYPKSTGHPVLTTRPSARRCSGRSTRTRSSAIGYNGNAAPADTIVTQRLLLRPRGLPLDAAGGPGLHVRPREGQGRPRRSRVHRRRRQRHPRVRGQGHHAAPVRARRVDGEPELRQAHHRLVRARSASTSTTRSSTTALSATSSSPTTATSSLPTSTWSSGAGAATSIPNFILSIMTTGLDRELE